MLRRWLRRNASRTQWLSPVLLLLTGLCSARKAVLSLGSHSPRCLSPRSSGLSLTCSGFSCFVASTFLSQCPLALAGVAVNSTALAITVQVARGQGFWGGFALESAVARICREAGARVSANVFLRDLDLPIGAMDQRRIEVIAEGLPVFHGAQLAINATLVSPLRADCEPQHRRCPEVDGAALTFARRRKEHTYPELVGGRGRARLVVVAGETVGRFSEETQTFLRLLAGAKTRSTPKVLRARARQSWLHRWGSILSCAAARAFACSLLGVHGNLGSDGDALGVSDVLSDFCRAPIAE